VTTFGGGGAHNLLLLLDRASKTLVTPLALSNDATLQQATTVSEISLISQNLKRSSDRDHSHVGIIQRILVHTANHSTKFEVSSFSRSRDIFGGGGWNLKWVRDNLSSIGWNSQRSICTPNLESLCKCKPPPKIPYNLTIQDSANDLLFDFRPNRNHASILYRFRLIASYLSKVANFNVPNLYLVPPLGRAPSIIAELSCGVVCVILSLTVLIQYQCMTDTHRRPTTAYTALA